MSAPLVVVRDLVKQYQALRPLRIQSLDLLPNAIVSISGLDAPAAEMLTGLLTGAVLPDSGDVRLLGQSTREVTDSEAWLAMLDDVGMVTDRAVLISEFTVEQNIAIPFTLQVDPVAAADKPRVAALSREVGLSDADLHRRVGDAPAGTVARVRLARALALDPRVLIAEHPTASLPREAVAEYASDVARVARARGLAVLVVSVDRAFVSALGGRRLAVDLATGALAEPRLWQRIFGGRSGAD